MSGEAWIPKRRWAEGRFGMVGRDNEKNGQFWREKNGQTCTLISVSYLLLKTLNPELNIYTADDCIYETIEKQLISYRNNEDAEISKTQKMMTSYSIH